MFRNDTYNDQMPIIWEKIKITPLPKGKKRVKPKFDADGELDIDEDDVGTDTKHRKRIEVSPLNSRIMKERLKNYLQNVHGYS